MAETTRMQALKQLAGAMPVASPQAAAGLQQAAALRAQRLAGSAPANAGIREVQAAGAGLAAAQGQAAVQQQAQGQQQAAQLGQLGIAEQQRADTQDLGQRKLALQARGRQQEAQLESIGRDYKQKLFDSRVQFETDESGRKMFNEYQLADWAVLKSKNHIELQKKMQDMEQASRLRTQALEAAHRKVTQAMEFEQARAEQTRDFTRARELAGAKQELERKLQAEQAKAANRMARNQAVGTMVGAGAGAVGGAPGAAAGASLGGGAATLATSKGWV